MYIDPQRPKLPKDGTRLYWGVAAVTWFIVVTLLAAFAILST